jgi:hypothetical protein
MRSKGSAYSWISLSNIRLNTISASLISEAYLKQVQPLTRILVACCSDPRWKSDSLNYGHCPYSGQTGMKSCDHVSGLPLAAVAWSRFAAAP